MIDTYKDPYETPYLMNFL